ncbi:hypothetical protein KIN_13100 [Litoreibacter roseus]|uniref:Uncharacterized protein n=1 Tax=Litoreibacter roseus TaxID=2601869 RepID=A0A6N6JDH1_9RHOB|nr:hypothetical protein KIN_13100 [Litoreibacter roseus]
MVGTGNGVDAVDLHKADLVDHALQVIRSGPSQPVAIQKDMSSLSVAEIHGQILHHAALVRHPERART